MLRRVMSRPRHYGAPFLGRNVSNVLREVPLVAFDILGCILPFAKDGVGRYRQDFAPEDRARSKWASTSATNTTSDCGGRPSRAMQSPGPELPSMIHASPRFICALLTDPSGPT